MLPSSPPPVMDYNFVNGLVYAQNYVYGEFDDSETMIDSYNPSTGRVWARIPG